MGHRRNWGEIIPDYLQQISFTFDNTNRLKVERQKTIYCVNSIQKRARVIILIWDKIDFKAKNYRQRKTFFLTDQSVNLSGIHNDLEDMYQYMHLTRDPKYMKQNWQNWREK